MFYEFYLISLVKIYTTEYQNMTETFNPGQLQYFLVFNNIYKEVPPEYVTRSLFLNIS